MRNSIQFEFCGFAVLKNGSHDFGSETFLRNDFLSKPSPHRRNGWSSNGVETSNRSRPFLRRIKKKKLELRENSIVKFKSFLIIFVVFAE